MKKVILLVGFFFALAIQPTFALDSWQDLPQNDCPPYPVISACNLQYIFETNLATINQALIGQPGRPELFKQSAAGFLGSSISYLLQKPPVSGIEFLAYESSRFHIPGTAFPAYAAAGPGGLGYASLGIGPVLKIWAAVRNLAYFVIAVIFVVAGMMIMFRSKTDPKTAITIQSALPKIILALILITFSYAIAGLLVDVMYVALALVVRVFNSIGDGRIGVGPDSMLDRMLSGSIFEFVTTGGWWDTTIAVSTAIWNVTNNMLETIVGGVLGSIGGLITGGLAILIVGIAILWALVKTWLALISAYANIILGIIYSPLQLMLDAIPGQKQFEGWVRTMLANLFTFPVVVAMLAIGSAIATNFGNGPLTEQGFIPPLMGIGDMGNALAFIGLGILLTIPKAVEIMQQILKAPQNKWGSAWGEAVNFGRARAFDIAGGGARGAGNYTLGKWADQRRDEWNNLPPGVDDAGGGVRGWIQDKFIDASLSRRAMRPKTK